MNKDLLNKTIFPLVIAVIAYFIVWFLMQLVFIRNLEDVLLDFRFSFKSHIKADQELEGGVTKAGEKVDTDIMIIGIDEESQKEENLGVWPWNRSVFADFLRYFRLPSQSVTEQIEAMMEQYTPQYVPYWEEEYKAQNGAPQTEEEKKAMQAYVDENLNMLREMIEEQFGEVDYREKYLQRDIQPELVFFDIFFDFYRDTKTNKKELLQEINMELNQGIEYQKQEIINILDSTLEIYTKKSDKEFFEEAAKQNEERKTIKKLLEAKLKEIQKDPEAYKKNKVDSLEENLKEFQASLEEFETKLEEKQKEIDGAETETAKADLQSEYDTMLNRKFEIEHKIEFLEKRITKAKQEIAILEERIDRKGQTYVLSDYFALKTTNERLSDEETKKRWEQIQKYVIKDVQNPEKLLNHERARALIFQDLKPPLAELQENVIPGGAMIEPEADEKIRRMPIIFAFHDERITGDDTVFLPTIDLVVALSYFNASIDNVKVVIGDGIYIKDIKIPRKARGEVNLGASEKPIMHITYDYEHIDEFKIPIDDEGKMLINFQGPNQSYDYRSFYEIRASQDQTRGNWANFRNRTLLVGFYTIAGIAENSKDYFMTPYGIMFGIEIHANALYTIFAQKFITDINPIAYELIKIGILLLFAIVLSRVSILKGSIVTFLVFIGFMTFGFWAFENMNMNITMIEPILIIMFGFLSITVYKVLTEEKDKKAIKGMFSNYVNAEVVNELIKDPEKLQLGGEDKELTVFFSDIRGFTSISERLSPQELVELLNEYLSTMTDIIFETQGTLDKYIGDAVMAFWNAPLDVKDHPLLACKACVKMLDELDKLNDKWPEEKQLAIGCGLNTGIMTVGNMGSQNRKNYTLMGDSVNLGARLESANKFYNTNILISEYTYERVKDSIIARELDYIRVKGKTEPVRIYELIAIKDSAK